MDKIVLSFSDTNSVLVGYITFDELWDIKHMIDDFLRSSNKDTFTFKNNDCRLSLGQVQKLGDI